MINSREIRREIESNRLSIVPSPDLNELTTAGDASVDLRLGRWIVELRHSRASSLAVTKSATRQSRWEVEVNEVYRLSRYHFVPFGDRFILHPGRFVLGSTLEWLALPPSLAAFVTGKSSWGRRGLIIETAVGIHPRFSGCLTLEIANVGEVPLELTPGVEICQVFFHRITETKSRVASQFSGKRRPVFGIIKKDRILKRLTNRPSNG
jgi:dCTP deaminase